MADGVAITPGLGTTIATDDVGGVQYQRVKVTFGDDGFATDASATNPLPVSISGTIPVSGSFYQATQPVSLAALPALATGANVIGGVTQSGAWSVGITGTVAVSLASQPLPTGAATETTIAALNTKTPALGQAVMASSRPVVIASNQSAIPVSGTFWQATQPVSLASQPLPSGAATETTLAALGTKLDTLHTDNATTGVTPGVAGTPSTDVLTVQGSGVSGSPQLVHARQGSQIYSGDTVLTPKFVKVAVSASGATTVISAVTGKKLRVLSMILVGNGAVNANLQSHTTTATATGLQYIAAAGGGAVLPPSSIGWFETVSGEALDINLSAAVAVGGQIVYVEV